QGKDQRRDRVANSRSRLRNSLAYSSNDLCNRGYKRSSDLADTLDNTLDELHEHPGNTFNAFQECSEVDVGKQRQASCKIANEISRRCGYQKQTKRCRKCTQRQAQRYNYWSNGSKQCCSDTKRSKS